MLFELTTAGITALQSAGSTPPVLGAAKFGDAYGYVPGVGDTNIRGALLHSTVVSAAQVYNSNTLVYTLYLDPTVGPFNFGEVGLYLPGGQLFALGSNGVPITKLPNSPAGKGNNLKIDCYVSTVGSSYSMYSSVANDETAKLNAFGSVDALPKAFQIEPNVCIVPHPAFPGQSILATANNGNWSLSEYTQPAAEGTFTSISPTVLGVNYTNLPFGSFPALAYPGYLVVQFLAGAAAGNIRIVSSTSANSVGIVSPLYEAPSVGDPFAVLACVNLDPDSISLLAGLDPGVTAAALNALIVGSGGAYLERDGSKAMLGNLNMGGNKLIGLAPPTLADEAVTLQHLNDALAGFSSVPVVGLTNGSFTTVSYSTTTATPNQVVDSFPVSSFRCAKYLIQVSSGSDFQISELLVVQDGATSYKTEFGTVKSGPSLATFDTAVSAGNLQLLVSPVSSTNEIKVLRSSLNV